MATIKELATQLADAFERDTRTNGKEFYKLRDGSPEWMDELVHHAHGKDMLPDDFRFYAVAMIARDLCDANGETREELADSDFEICDSLVSIYNADLIEWLGSHGARADYVDEAVKESGTPEGILQAIQWGQFAELREIFGLVLDRLADLAEESEGEESDE